MEIPLRDGRKVELSDAYSAVLARAIEVVTRYSDKLVSFEITGPYVPELSIPYSFRKMREKEVPHAIVKLEKLSESEVRALREEFHRDLVVGSSPDSYTALIFISPESLLQ